MVEEVRKEIYEAFSKLSNKFLKLAKETTCKTEREGFIAASFIVKEERKKYEK